MFEFAGRITERWRKWKTARAEVVLDDLKARYHTFRALLANNDLSLDLLKSLEQSFASPGRSRQDFPDTVEELLHVTYELVDGLNRLTGNGAVVLYKKHRFLADTIRQTLDELSSRSALGPACIFLDQLGGDGDLEVGAKAGSLSILKRAGFPVPDAFVIPPGACGEFLSANHIDLLAKTRFRRIFAGEPADGLDADAAEIRAAVLNAPIPERLSAELRRGLERLAPDGQPVSVRSSALVEDRQEHSFAGQFESVLNVVSFPSFERAFKEVLASNFSARATAYRIHAGLPAAGSDMAVICQRMVVARAAGVLFTLDPASPESGRMLCSAVPGLGTAAVGGTAPVDLYRPLRDHPEEEPMFLWTRIARKTHRTVVAPGGGTFEEELPDNEQDKPVLSEAEILSLVGMGRSIESLAGAPRDIEWAIAGDGSLHILQSRGFKTRIGNRRIAESIGGRSLMRAGVCASGGRCVGRVKRIFSAADLEAWRANAPGSILVLPQSMVEAALLLPVIAGVIVDAGNPADHLSCVAREYGRPMITGAGKATESLQDGRLIILDADRTAIYEAPEGSWQGFRMPGVVQAVDFKLPLSFPDAPRNGTNDPAAGGEHATPETIPLRPSPAARPVVPEMARLRELIEPLNLTDAYGPTFSILECRSLHDIIRYTHEKAVLAMFETGDNVLEEAEVLVHRLDGDVPVHVMLVDLGGGIAPRAKGFRISLEDVLSKPFRAIWEGIATPGLRWNVPAPMANLSGLFSRAMLDARSARPVGGQNYALVTADYMNLNARLEFHFTMVDAICGENPRENHIRFRFKGGGTSIEQRERRTRFIAEILKAYSFVTDLRGDLLTASITETHREEIEERLIVIGRLMGFTRLLDAAMTDDDMPARAARAFLEGDYALDGFTRDRTETSGVPRR